MTVGVILALVATTAIAAPAQAQNQGASALSGGYADCPVSHVCLWDNMNYRGGWLVLGSDSSDIGNWRDRANSMRNRTGYPVKLTDKRTLQPDDSIRYAANQSENDFGAFGWNNRIDKVEILD
ncbi:hypothetical protein GC106_35990 [Kibdelosporangium sp. 4NS15]|uniref:Peptidase inhibitor family I36 n=1 Tax=Kibdelosporangium persicum TaxID=2698649 RepID=A0ABX2F5E4_9PSEU|nr:hypothetical protein [Kibdelosporangium persicum]